MPAYCGDCGQELALTREKAGDDRDYLNTHCCEEHDGDQPYADYGTDNDDNSGHGGVLVTDGGTTVDAQSRRQAQKYQSLISRYPDAGWNEELLDKYADDVEADSDD